MPLPTRKLSDLLPLVQIHAPNVPNPVAEGHLRIAAREFCIATRCWRQTWTEPLTARNQPITGVPAYASIVEIESAFHDHRRLTPRAYGEFTRRQLTEDEGVPVHFTQENPNRLTVVPFEPGEILIVAFLAPLSAVDAAPDPADPLHDRNNVIPEFLFDLYGQEIAHGALSEILLIPGSFMQPEKATYFDGKWRDAKSKFTIGAKGQHSAPLRVKPQWM